LQTFFTVVIAGFAVAGIILGYSVIAGNSDEPAVPQKPETATPSPEEEEGYWTPERLNEAKPIEMPYAPWPPTSTEEPDTSQLGPSQSGAGSDGSGEVAPEEGTTLIPGLSKSDSGDDSTQ
jgi:hypothetical protein